MDLLFLIVLNFVAAPSFIGVGVYTIACGWYVIKNADFSPGSRFMTYRELMAHVPSPVRKLGFISICVFIFSLVLLLIAGLIFH